MADSVQVRILVDSPYQTVAHLTCISDGTGETGVLKIDKSALVPAVSGQEAAALDIEAVRWSIQGFAGIQLLWDHTVDDLALVLAGSGYEDWIGPGDTRGASKLPILTDPRSAGGMGDILLTSLGATANAVYDITLWLRKAPA